MKVFARDSGPLWYAGGLAFECGQCGRCCAGPEEGYVWATEDEIADIAAHSPIDTTQPAHLIGTLLRQLRGPAAFIRSSGDTIPRSSTHSISPLCPPFPESPPCRCRSCMTWTPWHFLVVAISGWMNREQQQVIDHAQHQFMLPEETGVRMNSRLPGLVFSGLGGFPDLPRRATVDGLMPSRLASSVPSRYFLSTMDAVASCIVL